jgi:hypothetical protein
MEHDPTTAQALANKTKLDTAADETTLSLAEFVPTAKRGVLLGIGAWLLLKQGAAPHTATTTDDEMNAKSASHISRPFSLHRCGWHWDCMIHFVNALCHSRNKLRVEVAGSGKILVSQFYFDHKTTVWDLRAQVLLHLDEGFDCRLFFGRQLEREWGVDENNARLIEIIPTAVFTGRSATPATGISLCVYASPMKRDDRRILLDMGCGRWAQLLSWDATSKEPLADWKGVDEAKGNELVKLDAGWKRLGGTCVCGALPVSFLWL